MKLTVVLSNSAPLIHEQRPVAYRRVTVNLTEAQVADLKRKVVGSVGGTEIREDFALCFIEEVR